jgi:hypothetical protein
VRALNRQALTPYERGCNPGLVFTISAMRSASAAR